MFDEEFIKNLKLPYKEPLNLPKIKYQPISLEYKYDGPLTIQEFQNICEFFGLPFFEPEIENNLENLLVYLTNLEIEYKNYNINLPNPKEFQLKLEKHNELLKMDNESDILEVRLSNIKYNLENYDEEYLKCLEHQVIELRNNCKIYNQNIEEIENIKYYIFDLTEKINFYKENKFKYNNYDYKTEFIKNELKNIHPGLYRTEMFRKYKNKIYKLKLLQTISSFQKVEAMIIKILVERKSIDYEKLHSILNIDRVVFLKSIYKLSYKNFIVYDTEKNIINLNYNFYD